MHRLNFMVLLKILVIRHLTNNLKFNLRGMSAANFHCPGAFRASTTFFVEKVCHMRFWVLTPVRDLKT